MNCDRSHAYKPKKQAIAHCVHMFYGVGDMKSNFMLKFNNWVELQRNIGIDEMRIYVLELEMKTIDYLNVKYKNFINFVDHLTTFEPMIYDKILKNCQHALKTVFSPIEG